MQSRPGVRETCGFRGAEAGWAGLGLLLWSLVGVPGLARAEPAVSTRAHPAAKSTFAPPPVPVDEMPAAYQARVRSLLERPTLRTVGAVETFNCQPVQYFWLLDHPDLTAHLWRCLGARVTGIESKGNGRFTWEDGQGSHVQWDTVLRTDRHRVWYAEGHVKAALLLPTVSVRALMVVTHHEGHDEDGRPAIRHQFEFVLQTDNAAVALAARLLGASAPHLAQQYVGQIEMFYGAMAWYLDEHPRQAASMFAELAQSPGEKQGARGSKGTPPPGPIPSPGVLTGGKS